ncbi:hypothetical protein GCM10010420_35760 [Streptomyces glaucosporus]|uniref:DUF1232 domain-containing protein n=1 Tax=Streptomyces glaucosporus TaxID=284044 RepID=A0ABN3IHK9_9ACTN
MDSRQIVLAVAGVAVASMLVAAAVLALRLVRTWRLVRGEDVTPRTRFVFWGALAYAALPLDLLPDPVYLDDIGLLWLAVRHIAGVAERRYGWDSRKADPPGLHR